MIMVDVYWQSQNGIVKNPLYVRLFANNCGSKNFTIEIGLRGVVFKIQDCVIRCKVENARSYPERGFSA